MKGKIMNIIHVKVFEDCTMEEFKDVLDSVSNYADCMYNEKELSHGIGIDLSIVPREDEDMTVKGYIWRVERSKAE